MIEKHWSSKNLETAKKRKENASSLGRIQDRNVSAAISEDPSRRNAAGGKHSRYTHISEVRQIRIDYCTEDVLVRKMLYKTVGGKTKQRAYGRLSATHTSKSCSTVLSSESLVGSRSSSHSEERASLPRTSR